MIKDDAVIVFQGDSITDADRNREIQDRVKDSQALGRGYAFLAAAKLLSEKPGLSIYNRGISGNRVTDMAQRWQVDALDLRPDLLSILIGVNDTWHGQHDSARHVPVDQYEAVYRQILDQTREALPQATLVLCEPFVLRCGAVTEAWFPEFDERRAVVRKLAQDYKTIFVPFQEVFDQACQRAQAELWAGDGVHPTLAGHMRMAEAWLEKVREAG